MTKFFANLILSAAVGVTAAMSVGAEVRGKVTGIAQEIRATAQQAVQSASDVFAGADASFALSLGASAEGNTESSAGVQTDVGANADVSTAGDAGLDLSGLFAATANANTDASLSAESQTETGAETEGAGFSLTNMINSTFGIGLGFGK